MLADPLGVETQDPLGVEGDPLGIEGPSAKDLAMARLGSSPEDINSASRLHGNQETYPYSPAQQDPNNDFTRAAGGGLPGVINAGMEALGQGVVKAADIPTKIANAVKGHSDPNNPLHRDTLEERTANGRNIINLPRVSGDGVVSGLANAGIGVAESAIGRPQSALTLPLAMGENLPAKIVSAGFANQMGTGVPEQVGRAIETLNNPQATAAQKSEAIASPIIATYFAKKLLEHVATTTKEGVSTPAEPVNPVEVLPPEAKLPPTQTIRETPAQTTKIAPEAPQASPDPLGVETQSELVPEPKPSLQVATAQETASPLTPEPDFANLPRPHEAGITKGLTLTEKDVPDLQKQQAEVQKAYTEATQNAKSAKDINAASGLLNQSTYLSGVIEGAKRKGPNYDLYLKDHPEAKPLTGESANETKAGMGNEQPETISPPQESTLPKEAINKPVSGEQPSLASENKPSQAAETAGKATEKPLSPISESGKPVTEPVTEPETKTPEQTKQEVENPTGIRNAIVDKEREARGLPPAIEPLKRTFGTVWDEAMAKIDKNPKVQDELIAELQKKPRAITDTEDALLLHRQVELQNEYGKVNDAINKASESGDAATVQENQLQADRIRDSLLGLYNVGKKAGTETARGLSARRMLANEDFSLAAMETKFRAAKGGEKLTPEETAKVNALHERYQKAEQALKDFQENAQPRIHPEVLRVAERIVKSLDKQADLARARIKARAGSAFAGVDPTVLADVVAIGASHLAHFSMDFAEWSGKMIEEFGEKVKPHLQSIYQKSQDVLDGLKTSEQVKRVVKDPEARALKSAKTRITNQTTKLESKIEAGDTSKPVRKPVVLDKEGLQLKANYEDAKTRFEQMVVNERLKNRTALEKTQDTFVKWRRGFLLSGPSTLAKLTSAAALRFILTPIEEAIGSGLAKIPGISQIAAKAPREGGLSLKAEAKAITEGLTTGMQDAWNTLKTGKSNLESAFGKKNLMPHELIDFIGSIHGALKAPVKRAEFSRSLQKRVEFALRNGIDVSDPLVQSKMALDAFKDAKRSIFMQDNRVTAAFNRAVASLEQVDKTTGKVPIGGKAAATILKVLLPIVKVPTNIVGETFVHEAGLVTGSTKAILALRKGVETLKPEEADQIMRHLKKGSLGAALLALGYYSPHAIGGYYQPNDKKNDGHPKFGTLQIGKHNIPQMLLHNPALEMLQVGATIRHVADSKLRKHDNDKQGVISGIVAANLGIADEIPFVRQQTELVKVLNPYERNQYFNQFAKDMIIPLGSSQVAQYFDKDKDGNYIPRKPVNTEGEIKQFWQTLETGIPGLREKVPVKK